jgi:hypothetical protein
MRVGSLPIVGFLAVCLWPYLAGAGSDFGVPRPVAAAAATDAEASDTHPAIATDDSGVWVALWQSTNTAFGVTDGERAIVFSRSTDDGATWSVPATIHPAFGDSEYDPSIATDNAGRWIAVWRTSGAIVACVSSDYATTWGTPAVVSSPSIVQLNPSVATDGAGVWVIAWSAATEPSDNLLGFDRDILFVRSTDNGESWTTASPLNTNAAMDSVLDFDVRIATDRAGTWGAVWSAEAPLFARSVDNGATWQTPVALGEDAGRSDEYLGYVYPDLATDGAGNWFAAWTKTDPNSYIEADIWFARSTNNGADWSAESAFHDYMSQDPASDFAPRVEYLPSGQWLAAWNSLGGLLTGKTGQDFDVLTSSSRDGGMSWSSPSTLVASARHDGWARDAWPAIAADADRTMVVWASEDNDGDTESDDYDIVVATAKNDCPATPRSDCRQSTSPAGSMLRINDSLGGRDLLTWRMRHIEATTSGDLGDPTTTDSFALCLYEKADGVAALVDEWDASGGALCGSESCWETSASSVSYRDLKLQRGSILSLKVRASETGKASVKARLSGPALAPPLLPLDLTAPVRLQLVNPNTGVCWEGVHDQAKFNSETKFASKSQ